MLRTPVGLAVVGLVVGGTVCIGIAVVKIALEGIDKASRCVGRT